MKRKEQNAPAYLSALGAWALAFGCVVGFGCFIMPGAVFLPLAGPVGTVLGLVLGALLMLLIGANYHYLMNGCAEPGGTYAYARNSFGYDHGFLTAWFLVSTYIAILWANVSALPVIARALFGDALQFGFHYAVAGFHVYMGEVLLAVLAIGLAAALCLRRSLAMRTQIVLCAAVIVGVVICFIAALLRGHAAQPFRPAFAPEYRPAAGVLIVFGLAPWAYVGFESLCHSSAEARFPLKKSFGIMAAALAAGCAVYALLSLLSVTALPEGRGSWADYLAHLGDYSGSESQPAFYAAQAAMGGAGSVLLGITALCAVLTGLTGCFIALSRLLRSLADDGLMPAWFGETDENHVPRNAIFFIAGVCVIFPFLGRTATGLVVDVTTVGAAIAYAITSAAAWKTARAEKNRRYVVTGILGVVVSLVFALEFLVPSFLGMKRMSAESYLMLSIWGILGFIYLRRLLTGDRKKQLGRSTFSLVILLGIIIYTSSIWLWQAANASVEKAVAPVQEQCLYYMTGARTGTAAEAAGAISESLPQPIETISGALSRGITFQVLLIVLALAIMVDIYAFVQRRERQTEIEKAIMEEAGHAKNSFLSNMSHEIRTPMNAIIGLDNMALRNPNLPPETRAQLEKIGVSAKSLMELLNNMLDLSLFGSGRMLLMEEEFSLQDFLRQVNDAVNDQCADKGLRYECRIVGTVCDFYYGDNAKLKRVLNNILDNAVKFTDAPGRILLTVEQPAEDESSCTLRFTVQDTGIGMDEAFLTKIFEPFSLEDMSNSNRFGGSGLGMAIAKNIVDMMHGEIEVESKKSVGSVFTVTVPLKRSGRGVQIENGLGETLRAAVVDSDPTSCERTRLVLRSIGIPADCFTDPWEAIGRIRGASQTESPYGLVITDYKLANLNGLELTRMIREFDGGKTAVIMLTGYNWDIIEDEAAQDGVDSVGAKPLFADSLLHEIQSVLAIKEGRQLPDEEEQTLPIETVLAGRRVLMAEDIDLNAEILQDILEIKEIVSERAENGKAAVEMFSAHPAGYYDAILMDVRMPVMDGLSATEAIRAMDRPDAKEIPIIAMTANVFDEDVQRSREVGMNAHLTKPVDAELLYEKLAEQIAAKK